MRWLLDRTETDGVVLDPFVGSGTTLVAAAEAGRYAAGIEREAEYIQIVRARVNAATEREGSDE